MTLAGKHILVTAGPTHEPIDPVRIIANRSSGRQGFAIAAAAAEAGARVTLVSGPVALQTPPGVERLQVETAEQMEARLAELVAAMDERDPDELMRDVYHEERHLLCPACRERYLANPLNLPLREGLL